MQICLLLATNMYNKRINQLIGMSFCCRLYKRTSVFSFVWSTAVCVTVPIWLMMSVLQTNSGTWLVYLLLLRAWYLVFSYCIWYKRWNSHLVGLVGHMLTERGRKMQKMLLHIIVWPQMLSAFTSCNQPIKTSTFGYLGHSLQWND